MADIAQTSLFFVIIALSFLLVVLGIQVFFILKDFRGTLSKTNKALDSVNLLMEEAASSAQSFSSMTALIKTGISLVNFLKKKNYGKKHRE